MSQSPSDHATGPIVPGDDERSGSPPDGNGDAPGPAFGPVGDEACWF